jgi:hypothetical protein
MAPKDTRTTKDLFRAWRSGDAEAGQAMAQRFADWYYAIATSRLGESGGREPCARACQRFGEGVVQVTESRNLVPWAHAIIADELSRRGGRAMDGDEKTAYTGGKSPKQLLAKARRALPGEIAVLEACYGRGAPDSELERLAKPYGGVPLGVLKARYTVKSYLKKSQAVPFDVAPDDPVLDRAPLPLYESGRMATAAEENSFEQWMLTDIDLCRDIAEFAQFAVALRGGVPEVAPEPRRAPERPRGEVEAPPSAPSRAGGLIAAGGAAAVIVIVLAVVVLVAVAAGLWMYIG